MTFNMLTPSLTTCKTTWEESYAEKIFELNWTLNEPKFLFASDSVGWVEVKFCLLIQNGKELINIKLQPRTCWKLWDTLEFFFCFYNRNQFYCCHEHFKGSPKFPEVQRFKLIKKLWTWVKFCLFVVRRSDVEKMRKINLIWPLNKNEKRNLIMISADSCFIVRDDCLQMLLTNLTW